MIVFLHGFLGQKSDWDQVIEWLPHPCIAFDLPGHGSSSIDFDLFSQLDKLPPFHLVGYSMGGRIARQYPGPVKSLTLISTNPGLKTDVAKSARLKSDTELAKDLLSMPVDEFLKRWYDQPLFKTLREKVDILKLRNEQDREGLAAALVKYSLGSYEVTEKKAHHIIGADDSAYRSLYANIPHTLIPNAGHAIHLENPTQLAKEIHEHMLSI